jgi:succinate-semialdehyde dehydrogenase/glutarate-semialdehyde dehydrogenase
MKSQLLYLNGKFCEGNSVIDIINPATEEPIARMSMTSRERVGKAISDAHDAFKSWRKETAKSRGDWLFKIAAQLETRKDEIARLITQENGKPLAQSMAEVAMSIDHLRWFGEEAKRAYGRVIPNWVESKRNLVIKSPIGVVGAISPWNFPLVLAVRKIAPALVAGCTVLLKPARQTPLCAVAFAECVHETGLPPGVFQLIQGKAKEIGAEFLENALVRKISFTGSTEVGQQLIRGAAEQVKPLSLELGGQGACLVFDSVDLPKAIEGVMLAKFRNTGQSCIAANRIYVQRSIYKDFLDLFTAKVIALKIGDGLEPGVEIGPLIDLDAIEKARHHVQDAISAGAKLLCGGDRIRNRKGFFFAPTVLADVPQGTLCTCEETFAPVAPVSSFDSEDEAIELANSTKYGLSAYAFTNDLSQAFCVMDRLEAGMIGLNDGVPTATQAPFGGTKMSGWGRELGSEGIEAFLETKHVSIGLS